LDSSEAADLDQYWLNEAQTPDRARWILQLAEHSEELTKLVASFVAEEPSALPTILDAFRSEAATSADPLPAECVSLVEYFRDHPNWTLETLAELRVSVRLKRSL
jgi:hypothetical protein